jgi:hypothetical protein
MDYPAVASTSIREVSWDSWRGTPELVAQIARASARAVRQQGSPEPRCRIEISVKGDLEEFYSPEAFQDRVTREALRDFDHLKISVDEPDDDLLIEVRFARAVDPLDPPDATQTETQTETPGPSSEFELIGWTWKKIVHPPGGVRLAVSAAESRADEVVAATSTVLAAINRGATYRGERLVLAIGTVLVVLAALASVSYLLMGHSAAIPGWIKDWSIPLALTVGAFFFALLGFFANWLRPPVEVADLHKTRLWSAVKFVGTPLLALIVSGIGKAIWG